MTGTSPAVTKAEARRRLRTARRQLDAEQQRIGGELLADVLSALISADAVVAGFLPIPGEPNLLPFVHRHSARGGEVYLPVITDPEQRRMQWAPWSNEASLQPSSFAPVTEPTGPRVATPDLLSEGLLMLVPALAVDTAGARLGQGGGYYDTLFTEVPQLSDVGQVLAVVHPWEVMEPGSFPVEAHDLRLTSAVTETGLVSLG